MDACDRGDEDFFIGRSARLAEPEPRTAETAEDAEGAEEIGQKIKVLAVAMHGKMILRRPIMSSDLASTLRRQNMGVVVSLLTSSMPLNPRAMKARLISIRRPGDCSSDGRRSGVGGRGCR